MAALFTITGDLDRALAGAGGDDGVPRPFQGHLLRHRDQRFVFHEENRLSVGCALHGDIDFL
jgi:hypothetical protein